MAAPASLLPTCALALESSLELRALCAEEASEATGPPPQWREVSFSSSVSGALPSPFHPRRHQVSCPSSLIHLQRSCHLVCRCSCVALSLHATSVGSTANFLGWLKKGGANGEFRSRARRSSALVVQSHHLMAHLASRHRSGHLHLSRRRGRRRRPPELARATFAHWMACRRSGLTAAHCQFLQLVFADRRVQAFAARPPSQTSADCLVQACAARCLTVRWLRPLVPRPLAAGECVHVRHE